MHRARFMRSTPFRLALIFSALFISAFIVSSFIAVQTVRRHLVHKLDSDISNTYSIISASYGDSDIEDVVGSVQNHVAITDPADEIFLLTDARKSLIAGDIGAASFPMGWSTVTASDLGLHGVERYRLYSGAVGGGYELVIGKSYREMEEVGSITATTFMWATLIVLIGAVAGAIFLAIRLQQRMDSIAQTMIQVSEGELGARIPLLRNGDDIDVLSGQINAMLDRLSGLFEGMKQVSADIAHDLKTPLNRLKLTIQTAIAKQEKSMSIARELAAADFESDSINATFDALLRIAQIEAGARKSRFAPVVLKEVSETIVEAYIDVASNNEQTLLLDVDAVNTTILGDRQLLLQMCANLVENALIHCSAGTLIWIFLKENAGGISLSVADNGPGIPECETTNVLRRLYRLEKSRTTPGSGLGLSMVKAIADLHGARLTLADNSPGLRVTVNFKVVTA